MTARQMLVALGVNLLTLIPSAATADTGFLNRVVTVDGVEYRYQVFVPANYDRSQRWPVILFLHGGGERGDDGLRQTDVGIARAIRRDPARFPAIVVMPQSRRDMLWTGAMERQAIAALDRTVIEFNGDPDRVYLTGLSLGGQGTWYTLDLHPDRFAAAIGICGRIIPFAKAGTELADAIRDRHPFLQAADPFAALASRLRHLPIRLFHGSADKTVPPDESRKMAEALKAAGADVRYTEYEGVGHNSWDKAYEEPGLIEWLLQQRRPSRVRADVNVGATPELTGTR